MRKYLSIEKYVSNIVTQQHRNIVIEKRNWGLEPYDLLLGAEKNGNKLFATKRPHTLN